MDQELGSIIVMKQSHQAKLLIYWFVFISTFSCGHEVWIITEKIKSWIRVVEMSFLCKAGGLNLREKVRTSTYGEELN